MIAQSEAILTDLKAGVALTPLDALNRHHCLRLAARVRDLRKAGWPIQTEWVKSNGARYARYRLPVAPKQESWL